MNLPKEIKEIFFETLYGDKNVLDFEQWLYTDSQLEHILPPADYLDLISYGYKGDRAEQGLFTLLEKHIHEGEYKLWKLIRQKRSRVQEPQVTTINTPFDGQLQRIKDKLSEAKTADAECGGFGSETHEYLISEPATEEEVLAFEARYAVQLPPCYRSFLLKVGNGGIGYDGAGAGPFFGIYPLGGGLNELVYNSDGSYLKYKCLIDPDIITDRMKHISAHQLFGGILPLGYQGCTYYHGIVLNGPHKGRLVNLDNDRNIPPIFAKHANFLDWYENWLDEVIDGTQREMDSPMFGY